MNLRSLLSAAALTVVISLSSSLAQGQPSGGGPGGMMGGGGPGWGPGMMMGPGMMHGRGMWGGRGGMCDPRFAGLAEWRIGQIERAVQPTDAQRAALNELRSASTKAAESLAAACPRDLPATSVARLELMEKRMEAMLASLKTVRPAFDAFYATLSDEQKARLDRAGPRRWGWDRWH